MDGDICDLPAYVELKKKYGCMLMCDEAHSFGVIGKTGCGAREHFGISGSEVDIWMGTLSKSVASCGGWIGGSAALVRYLRYTAPGFVYSAGITPANGMAALKSLELMIEEPWRVEKLQHNAQFFHDELVKRGIDTGPALGGSGVIPAITGNSLHALLLSQRLVEQGVNVQPIVYPAVADDASRLRFFLSSTHTEDELSHTAERVATNLAAIREEFPAPK
jgi:7-keto-8-aminopelargonate synthetase-like enzyme